MKIADHVYNMHIDDGAPSHPGGSNNYFVGDPSDEMILVCVDIRLKWKIIALSFSVSPPFATSRPCAFAPLR